MKKSLIITTAFIMAISSTAFTGCAVRSVPSKKPVTPAVRTVKTDERATEPKKSYSYETNQQATEAQAESEFDSITEPQTKSAGEYAKEAYYEYLQNHYDWFNNTTDEYQSRNENNKIALKDLDYDGVDELIFVKNADSRGLKCNLTIATYKDGGIKTLYDEELFVNAGAEPVYEIIVTDNSEVYSVLNHHPNSNVIKYKIDYSSVYATRVAETKGQCTGDPNVDCYINDNKVSNTEYRSFVDSIKSDAIAYLCYNNSNVSNINANDISMSYGEALEYLRG